MYLADPYADMIMADGITLFCNDIQVYLKVKGDFHAFNENSVLL